MNLSDKQQLFAQDIVRLLQYMSQCGYSYTFGEAYRTAEQAELYEKSGKGIKNSLHCKRLALDINLFDNQGAFLVETKDHEQFGKYWQSLSPMNRWGGYFAKPDGNHYERQEFASK